MVTWKIKATILALVFPFFLLANADEILQKLDKKYKIDIFSASFQQTNIWNDIEVTKKSEGEMFYNNERLILNYSNPEGQQLLLEGKKLSIYDRENNQLIISEIDDVITQIKPIEIIKYYWNKSEITIDETDTETIVSMIPQVEDIKKIVVYLDSKNFSIKKLMYFDLENNQVEFEFISENLNPKFDDQTFLLNLKENVNIIQN